MCFFHFIEAVECLFPVAYERMNEKGVEGRFIGAGLCGFNGVSLVLLDNAHKADDVAVVDFAEVNGLSTVLADFCRNLNNVIGLEEGQSVAVLDVDNLNVADIVCN